MEKLLQDTTSGVPEWRVGLEDRIDPLSLRLVDECLSYGYQSAAEWKAQSALNEAFQSQQGEAPLSLTNEGMVAR